MSSRWLSPLSVRVPRAERGLVVWYMRERTVPAFPRSHTFSIKLRSMKLFAKSVNMVAI
jgi:hypothetical protein